MSIDSTPESQARSLPYIRHFVANWAFDTEHLSLAESGALINLVGRYWSEGSLPNDETKLARYARATSDEWEIVGPAVVAMFQIDGDVLRHASLDKERGHANGVSGGRRKGGIASGAARRNKASGS